MLPLVTAVLFASLLGSLHCAGMCGAFLALAVGAEPGRPAPWTAQATYHLGRLITYVTLGVAAGAVGKALNLAGTLAGIVPLATALAGALMVGFGVVALLRLKGVAVPELRPPAVLRSLSSRGHRAALAQSAHVRPLLIGLLTTLLPCGWLYAFVITAAGTGSPAWGAAAMASFWVGTLPVMVTLGTGLRFGLGALGNRLPTLTCLALIAVGLWTLVGRNTLSVAGLLERAQPTASAGTALPDPTQTPACCKPKESDAGDR
jgi:uncharacterized protein